MATPYANSLHIPPKNEDLIATKIPENQGEISVEFLGSDILSLKLKVVNYFEGNSEHEVERHFRKAFYSSMANNTKELGDPSANSLPMRKRKLPSSFWRQDLGNASERDIAMKHLLFQAYTQNMYTDSQNITQFPNNFTTTNATGQLQTYVTCNTIGPQFNGQSQCRYSNAPLLGYQASVSSRLVSYSKIPMSVMSAPNVTITHAQMDARPRCSIPDAPAVYYTCGPTTGHGFNPRYNSLLVQPDVMLQLPLVHGQQRGTGARRG